MSVKKKLKVTFLLDADDYAAMGNLMLPMARENAWNLIFKHAEMHVLETLLHAAARPSGNQSADLLFRNSLKAELAAIRAAALTATYEIIEEHTQP